MIHCICSRQFSTYPKKWNHFWLSLWKGSLDMLHHNWMENPEWRGFLSFSYQNSWKTYQEEDSWRQTRFLSCDNRTTGRKQHGGRLCSGPRLISMKGWRRNGGGQLGAARMSPVPILKERGLASLLWGVRLFFRRSTPHILCQLVSRLLIIFTTSNGWAEFY